jgi:hypothetical protein
MEKMNFIKIKIQLKKEFLNMDFIDLNFKIFNMTRIFFILLFAFVSFFIKAQNNVGIGILNPHPSALLDLTATDMGFLVPRMDSLQRNAIATPANGLIVYDNNYQCLYYYKGNVWQSLCDTRFDSIKVTIATFDTVFASFASFDTLFANFVRFDSLFVNFASFDTLFSQLAYFDSIFSHIASFDTVYASIAQFDTLFAAFSRIDTLYSHIIYTDSLVVNGVPLQTIINNAITNAVNGSAWLLTGNGGTTPATNFIGTTDNQGFAIRTNNTERVRVTNTGNVGIGTSAPAASAALEISSSTNDKGLLVPRLTTAQRISIVSPANGLYVYDITVGCFFSYNSTQAAWVSMCPEPRGIIVMWSGTLANIPSGYALCDGSNGTPDLRDRFILSVNTAENPGATGGAHSITLTSAQMPAHTHSGTTANSGGHTHTGTTSSDGSHTHTGTTNTVANHTHDMTHNHSINDPGHSHVVAGNNTFSGDGSTFETDNSTNSQPRNTTTNTTGISVNTFTGSTGSGGSHNHTFTSDAGGTHSHTLNIVTNGDHNHTFTTGSTGSGSAVDNRPAYYKLAFIMKL